jgi:diguanylate cyclase (GGDEF)-like protein/PAS domain S-box-containing protein
MSSETLTSTETRPAERPGNLGVRAIEIIGQVSKAWRDAGRPCQIYTILGLLFAFGYFFAPPGLGHHLLYEVIGLSSVIAILVGVRMHKPASRLPWYLFAAGLFLFVLGDSTRAYYEVIQGVESPFPGLADIGYLAAYPVLICGMAALVMTRDKVNDKANVIDSLIFTVSLGVVMWVYLMEPYVADPHVTGLELIISIAYPLMDVLILGMAVRLIMSRGSRPPAYYLLIASLIGLVASDSAYTFTLLNETYHTGLLVDAGWLISYVLWGAAALHPSMVELSKPIEQNREDFSITKRRLVILTFVTLLAPIVRIIETVRGNDPTVGSTVAPTVILFLLVMARMSGLVTRLTDALNRHQIAERRRRQSEARFGSLIQHASDVVTVTDHNGQVIFQSPSVKRVLGYRRDELMGTSLDDLVHEDDQAAAREMLQAVAANGSDQPVAVRFRWRHRDGSWRDMEAILTNLLQDPTVAGVVLNARDVTEQVRLQAELEHQAFHDPLTDLANRALFRDRVEHALERRSAPDEPISVLFLDIDNFKTVNDSLGHSAGDQLLVDLANRIRECVRTEDTAARLGGDEFAVLLERSEDAQIVAERIGDALNTPFFIDAKEVFVTVSVGISISELARGGADELLRDADAAMYTAKSAGGARAVVFRPDMHLRALKRLDLEGELRRAVNKDEFRLHYQPIVDLDERRICGFEALVRWAHPERGLLGPNEFIPIAEETGLIRPIGRWVLSEATRQAAAWQAKFGSELTMAVNLSPQELAARELCADVNRAIAESGITPETLVLEMTERVLMADTELTTQKLDEIRQLGVRLSVDDFGTGFSSLSYLRTFPIDSLKIAKPFVDNIPMGEQETALVRGIIELGHNLELEIVGEGIERAAQWHALREMGCDTGQGYLMARPQSPERIEKLLETDSLELPVDPSDPAPVVA